MIIKSFEYGTNTHLPDRLVQKYNYFLFYLVVFFLPAPSTAWSQVGNSDLNLGDRYRFRKITVNEGLSQNMISSICQDHNGYIWIGTRDGLNLFDGSHFTAFKYERTDSFPLLDNHITAIHEDKNNHLWIGTFNEGLFYFDREHGRFIQFSHDPENEKSLSNNIIQSITSDSTGNLWIGTNGGGLNRLNFNGDRGLMEADSVQITRYDGPDHFFPEKKARIYTLLVDRKNQLWVGTQDNIFRYSPGKKQAVFEKMDFILPNDSARFSESGLSENFTGARIIFDDKKGNIWMGNPHGLFRYVQDQHCFSRFNPPGKELPLMDVMTGTPFINRGREEIWISDKERMLILDLTTGNHVLLSNQKENYLGLQRGWFSCFCADKGGSLWIGSNGYGLSIFSPAFVRFSYPNDSLNMQGNGLNSVRDLSIRAFYESQSKPGALWIGSNHGLFYKPPRSTFLKNILFQGMPEGQPGLIYHFSEDNNGFLWIASTRGLIRYNPADQTSRLFIRDSSNAKEIDNRICFVYCQNDDVWVLTPNELARFDQQKRQFHLFPYSNTKVDVNDDPVFPSLCEDSKGDLWLAAKNGLHHFNLKSMSFVPVKGKQQLENSPLNGEISVILPDPEKPERYLWLGTAIQGFCRYDIQTGNLLAYTEKDGLPDNTVYGMLSDRKGYIWISTNRGLTRFEPHSQKFTLFTTDDGLQSNEFNRGAYYKSKDGKMFFGGIHGYNFFNPSDIELSNFMAPVVFTGIYFYDADHSKLVHNYKVFKNKTHLELSHNKRNFTVEFASLDYTSPANNEFAFSMSSSGDRWIPIGNHKSVTFTSLSQGDYILKVRATNSDGIWSDRVASMNITISKPWWASVQAYIGYIGLLLFILYNIRRYEVSRMMMRNQLKLAGIEAANLKELDLHKSRFFANISHEFRTPLTLINGPLERLIKEETDSIRKRTYNLMLKNSNRLLQLINQLLDLSKLESGRYYLKACKRDVTHFVEGIAMSFASLAEQKEINLILSLNRESNDQEILDSFYFDADILEKILVNLLSNAFRYTNPGGSVNVILSTVKEEYGPGYVEFTIHDTGVGIPKDQITSIFNRFYQVSQPALSDTGGTGIGLAFVNELVRVHKGEIRVDSTPGRGSTFSLRIPSGKEHFTTGQWIEDVTDSPHNGPSKKLLTDSGMPVLSFDPEKEEGKPWILVVEDHLPVRQFIVDSIRDNYRTIEASGAEEGFRKAEEFIPDLIISDVMMPLTDGFEMCKWIKSSIKTSHIPIILLSARAGLNDRITGLNIGADEYLAKPFNTPELLSRIGNLIKNRESLRKKFSSREVINPGEVLVTPHDTVFMQKIMRLVNENLGNKDFSVKDLATESGMSLSQLHRKLKAIINMTANQLIRSVRMHHAMSLLQKGAGNISEVAYMVGYDPGYFTKSFHNFFGKLPSEINADLK
ncbi:MAG TPA: two-component regulator propeller domain-containing protein [Bacteroidales bacterium]|nr:two-component regulator propeller domain-containing protein [Bacteroidales bacterium]